MTAPLEVRKILFKRNLFAIVGLLIVGILTLGAMTATEFDIGKSLESFPKAAEWLAKNFIPNAKAIRNLPSILDKMGETFVISVMATMFAGFFAFFLSLCASTTTRPHPVLTWIVRGIASVFRNIPSVVWAMVFLISIGQSNLTGFLALFLETLGFLIRAFTETIDETSASSVEALKASGATWSQTVFQAVLPSVAPQSLSWILYLLENNIRSATLVGLLTGTGIGFIFDVYYKSLNYPSAALVIMVIVIVVLILEFVSNMLRRIIL